MTALAEKIAPYKSQLRHSARITASALAAFGVVHFLQMPQSYWVAFTAILVVQSNVGSSVKAAFERMLGNVTGGIYGALVSTIFTRLDHAFFPLEVIVGIAPVAFLAAVKPSFRTSSITVAIVLFGNAAQHTSAADYAEHRVLEIGIGCVIGLIVSLTVLPARAHHVLSVAAAKVLNTYADLLARLLDVAAGKLDYAAVEGEHAKIRAAITKLETVGDEAKRERFSRLTDEPDPDPLLRMVRRIRFDLVMIGRAVAQPFPKDVAQALSAPLAALSSVSVELLQAASAALTEEKPHKSSESFDPVYDAFAATLTALHKPRSLSDADTGRLYTLGFVLEQLRLNLHDLSSRANEFGVEDGAAAIKQD